MTEQRKKQMLKLNIRILVLLTNSFFYTRQLKLEEVQAADVKSNIMH